MKVLSVYFSNTRTRLFMFELQKRSGAFGPDVRKYLSHRNRRLVIDFVFNLVT